MEGVLGHLRPSSGSRGNFPPSSQTSTTAQDRDREADRLKLLAELNAQAIEREQQLKKELIAERVKESLIVRNDPIKEIVREFHHVVHPPPVPQQFTQTPTHIHHNTQNILNQPVHLHQQFNSLHTTALQHNQAVTFQQLFLQATAQSQQPPVYTQPAITDLRRTNDPVKRTLAIADIQSDLEPVKQEVKKLSKERFEPFVPDVDTKGDKDPAKDRPQPKTAPMPYPAPYIPRADPESSRPKIKPPSLMPSLKKRDTVALSKPAKKAPFTGRSNTVAGDLREIAIQRMQELGNSSTGHANQRAAQRTNQNLFELGKRKYKGEQPQFQPRPRRFMNLAFGQ